MLDELKGDGFGIAPEIWMGIMLAAVVVVVLMSMTPWDAAYGLVLYGR